MLRIYHNGWTDYAQRSIHRSKAIATPNQEDMPFTFAIRLPGTLSDDSEMP